MVTQFDQELPGTDVKNNPYPGIRPQGICFGILISFTRKSLTGSVTRRPYHYKPFPQGFGSRSFCSESLILLPRACYLHRRKYTCNLSFQASHLQARPDCLALLQSPPLTHRRQSSVARRGAFGPPRGSLSGKWSWGKPVAHKPAKWILGQFHYWCHGQGRSLATQSPPSLSFLICQVGINGICPVPGFYEAQMEFRPHLLVSPLLSMPPSLCARYCCECFR